MRLTALLAWLAVLACVWASLATAESSDDGFAGWDDAQRGDLEDKIEELQELLKQQQNGSGSYAERNLDASIQQLEQDIAEMKWALRRERERVVEELRSLSEEEAAEPAAEAASAAGGAAADSAAAVTGGPALAAQLTQPVPAIPSVSPAEIGPAATTTAVAAASTTGSATQPPVPASTTTAAAHAQAVAGSDAIKPAVVQPAAVAASSGSAAPAPATAYPAASAPDAATGRSSGLEPEFVDDLAALKAEEQSSGVTAAAAAGQRGATGVSIPEGMVAPTLTGSVAADGSSSGAHIAWIKRSHAAEAGAAAGEGEGAVSRGDGDGEYGGRVKVPKAYPGTEQQQQSTHWQVHHSPRVVRPVLDPTPPPARLFVGGVEQPQQQRYPHTWPDASQPLPGDQADGEGEGAAGSTGGAAPPAPDPHSMDPGTEAPIVSEADTVNDDEPFAEARVFEVDADDDVPGSNHNVHDRHHARRRGHRHRGSSEGASEGSSDRSSEGAEQQQPAERFRRSPARSHASSPPASLASSSRASRLRASTAAAPASASASHPASHATSRAALRAASRLRARSDLSPDDLVELEAEAQAELEVETQLRVAERQQRQQQRRRSAAALQP